jgi:hypothetical protein
MDGKFGKYYGLPNIFFAPILSMLINKAIAHKDVAITIVFTHLFMNTFAFSKCLLYITHMQFETHDMA